MLVTGPAVPAPACSVSWDGGAGTNGWDDADNWSTDAVPGATDHVCIGAAFTVDHGSGTDEVLSVQSAGTLELSGGSLSLTDTANDSTAAALAVSGGELTGGATLTVSGTLDWTGGFQSGSGRTTVASGGALTVDSASGVFLERTLRLAGAGSVVGEGGISFDADGALEVAGSGSFEIESDADFSVFGGGRIVVEAGGEFSKTAGAAESSVDAEFDNDGTIVAATGVLRFGGGDVSGAVQNGQFVASAGAELRFDAGTFTLGPASSASGTGAVSVDGAAIAFGGAYDVDGTTSVSFGTAAFAGSASTGTLSQSGGTVGGSGTLIVSGAMTWTGGTQGGDGQTTIPDGVTLTVDSPFGVSLEARTLRIDGTAGVVADGGIDFVDGGVLEVAGGGSLELASDADLFAFPGGGRLVVETGGALAKTGGSDISTVDPELHNQGAVRAEAGELQLTGGDGSATQTSAFAGDGGILSFSGGQWDLGPGTALSGQVELELDPGAVTIPSGVVVPAEALEFSVGSLRGGGTLRVDDSLTWSGGEMAGMGTTVIAPGAELAVTLGSIVELQEAWSLVNRGHAVVEAFRLFVRDGATIQNVGTLEVRDTSQIVGSLASLFHNRGTLLRPSAAGTSRVTSQVDNDGTIEVGGGTLDLGRLLNASTGGILATGASLTGGRYVARSGTLKLSLTADITVNGAAIVLDGAAAQIVNQFGDPALSLARNAGGGQLTLQNGAILAVPGALLNLGRITGNGTLDGDLSNLSGEVAPGLSGPGVLHVDGAYTQGAGGTLRIQVDGTSGFDRLEVTGAAQLAGTLATTTTGPLPAPGAVFEILSAFSRAGTFATVTGADLGGGLHYDVGYGATNVTLTAVMNAPAPEPQAEAPESAKDVRAAIVAARSGLRRAMPSRKPRQAELERRLHRLLRRAQCEPSC